MPSPRPPLTVLVDATALTSVGADSGVGAYTRGLLAGLAGLDDIKPVALAETSARLPDGVDRFRVRRLRLAPRGEVIQHAMALPTELVFAPGDVFHNPGFHAPLGVRRRWVQTLLDVIPLVRDDPDLAALKKRWQRFGPRYRNADAVIAISRHAADEGIRLLGLDPHKVHVAPLGIDPTYTPGDPATSGDPATPGDPTAMGDPPPLGEPADARGRKQPDRPYLLLVSEFSARKGFAEAFAVIDELADAGLPHTLKVAGRVHDWHQAALHAVRQKARHPERVELLGFVPDLVPLYRGADALLMASRYEGFGLPAVEAMACGIPVVAFANSAVTEVVGDGGILVTDGDVAEMAAATRRILANPTLAGELSERGVARAGTFTWERAARLHADVYRSVSE